jgi:hypothetical protein
LLTLKQSGGRSTQSLCDPKKESEMVPFFCLFKKNHYLCLMKLTKKEQLFMDLLEKEGVVWVFDYILLDTKDKKGYDKVIGYKAWNIAYDLVNKGLIKVNPENKSSWVKA